jgi:NADH-quinone oxidoreductase subunit G
MCDEGRYGYHFANSPDRILRPAVEGKRTTWHELLPKLKADLAAQAPTVVLSPYLTVEEAYLFALAFKTLSKDARLVLGWVPVVGEDDRYPKDVRGNPVEPTKFTIRAEKCPNRLGVETVLKHFQGEVLRVEAENRGTTSPVFFAGGYPNPSWAQFPLPESPFVVVQDLFPSALTAAAKVVLPATSAFEKDGTFVNHAGLAQTFPRAVRPPTEVRSELQVAFDLLGRKGLVQAATIRKELAGAIAAFAGLAEEKPARDGKKIELQTVQTESASRAP